MRTVGVLLTALVSVTLAYPNSVQCDLKVVPGKATSGQSVMTVGRIMGKAPQTDNNLAVPSTTTYSDGGKVTFTFGQNFLGGLYHANTGTFEGTGDFQAAR
jgi:hypothetical protein